MSTPIILQHGERRSGKAIEVELEGGQCAMIKPGESLELTLDAEGDILVREVDLPPAADAVAAEEQDAPADAVAGDQAPEPATDAEAAQS